MDIEDNCKIRTFYNEFVLTFLSENKDKEDYYRARLIELLTVQKQLPIEEEDMNSEQAREFENVEMKFGKYKGVKIKDVPTEYLCYITDVNTFEKRLSTYLKYCYKRNLR